MRTVTFQSVYEAILRRHGFDPLGDAVGQDTARAITEHINDRASTAWASWDWPDLTLTEERAYRPVWNPLIQYHKAGENGFPDEVFYIPNVTYYKVNPSAPADPPFGSAPVVATSFWLVLDPVTTFVARDQVGMRPMGDVLGVYKSNPSLNGCCPSDLCLKFRPSELGVSVCGGPAPTVFIQYRIPEPVYTMRPFVAFKTYLVGDTAYNTADGNCYTCIANTNTDTIGNPVFWALIPMPATFAAYIKPGAYADCLRETFTAGEEQIRLARAQLADAEADSNLEQAIDQLQAQGQVSWYNIFQDSRWLSYNAARCGGVCITRPWTGNIVYPLNLPVGPPSTGPGPAVPVGKPPMIYLPDVTSLT